MELGEEIVLRPRFTIDFEVEADQLLKAFEHSDPMDTDLKVTRVDHHVFIKIPKHKQHFWSPQLDLEILTFEPDTCVVKGLFGPKPAVWTMFMFMHFVVIALFCAFGVWAYTNASLEQPYAVQVFLMGLMVLIWFVLYFAGRMGKTAGRDEMMMQYRFMRDVIRPFY